MLFVYSGLCGWWVEDVSHGRVVGMILAIPIGMILINLYEAGAFDTLVWCVREVVNDFNNFRKVGGEKK